MIGLRTGVTRGPYSAVQNLLKDGATVEPYAGPLTPPKCGTLYPVQEAGVRQGIASCEATGGFVLADEMGMGKTIQAIRIAAHMAPKRVFVLCPASVKQQWEEEIARWGPDEACSAPEWHIGSHHSLLKGPPSAFAPGDMVILDEMHMISRRQAETLATMDAGYRIGMSGTISEKKGEGYRSLAWVIRTRPSYVRAALLGRIGSVNHLRVIGVMVRRRKRLLRLPQTTYTIVAGGVETQLTDVYAAMSRLRSGNSTPVSEEDVRKSAEKALERARSFSASEPCLVFCHRKEVGAALQRRTGWGWIHGGVPAGKRQGVIDRAKERGEGLIVSMRAGGTGLNLQFLSAIRFVEVDWSAKQVLQCIGRIVRPGMPGPAHVTIIMPDGNMGARMGKLIADKALRL